MYGPDKMTVDCGEEGRAAERTHTITLTDEQVMTVLAALSDRYSILSVDACKEDCDWWRKWHQDARNETSSVNWHIRRQTGKV